MNIKVDHIPRSTAHNRRPGTRMTPIAITVHSTGNLKSTARNERDWLENPSNTRTASWHYVVDENEIIEAIPPNEVAWHATDGSGDGNMRTISIEMCESGNRERVLERTQELIRYLMDKHRVRVIKRHYDWYKAKGCPRILNEDGKWTQWFQFLAEIFQPKKEEDQMSQVLKPLEPSQIKDNQKRMLARLVQTGLIAADYKPSTLDLHYFSLFDAQNRKLGLYK